MNTDKKCTYKKGALTPEKLTAFGQTVQIKLGQGQYSAVVPTVNEVTVLIQALIPLQEQCRLRNYESKPQRDYYRKLLDDALSAQCRWINGMANGNIEFLAQSGFTLSKDPQPRPEPAQAIITVIEPLQGGTAIVKVKNVANKEYYQAKITGPGGFVKWKTSLYAKMKIADLLTGVTLTIAVRAVNGKGLGEWSDTQNFVLPIATQQDEVQS